MRLFLLLMPLLAFVPHKYYVSTTDMYYKPEKQQVQLVVRVFTDDFSKALSKHVGASIALDPDNKADDDMEVLISNYFKEHFVVYGLPTDSYFSFVGREYKQDQTYLYASFDHVPEMDVLEWSNTFLIATFPEQKNIVTLTTSTAKKSFLHTKEVNFAQFDF
ncbi:MAG: hypothetical protein O2918_03535 [Bacteroidetes bacterium]|nr:hypothetical protein [Bacteroidota bacterium]